MTKPVSKPVPLARLLAVGYAQLVEGLHERLAAAGWDDVRPAYGFVLLSLRGRESSVSELAGLLGVSKQATSKLLDQMAAGEYVTRVTSTADARQRMVALAPRGRRLLAVVEEIYAELEAEWATVIGGKEVERLRITLTQVVLATNEGRFPPVRPGP
jgi:DNA-binding MarR family transcriptional regulator